MAHFGEGRGCAGRFYVHFPREKSVCNYTEIIIYFHRSFGRAGLRIVKVWAVGVGYFKIHYKCKLYLFIFFSLDKIASFSAVGKHVCAFSCSHFCNPGKTTCLRWCLTWVRWIVDIIIIIVPRRRYQLFASFIESAEVYTWRLANDFASLWVMSYEGNGWVSIPCLLIECGN